VSVSCCFLDYAKTPLFFLDVYSMEDKRDLPYLYAQLQLQGLGRVLEEINKEQSQSSEIVVWLVGLTTGLIALGLTDIGIVRDLMPIAHIISLLLLVGTVLFGVAYRMLEFWIARENRELNLHQTGVWLGIMIVLDAAKPDASDSSAMAKHERRMTTMQKVTAAYIGKTHEEFTAHPLTDEKLGRVVN
jgi:hypothetical protein